MKGYESSLYFFHIIMYNEIAVNKFCPSIIIEKHGQGYDLINLGG